MFKKLIRKSKLILLLLIVLTISFSIFKNVQATALSDARDAYDAIIAQQKATVASLSGVEKEIAQYNYDITLLDQKITESTIQLNDLQDKVDAVNKKLEEQETSLQNSAQSYNAAEDMYTTRLRAIYENGMPNILDILFSSSGITDFFSKMNVYTSVLEYDKSLVTNIKNQKEYVDYIKQDIEVQKLQLDQLKYDKEKTTATLNDAMDAKENKVKSLQNEKSSLAAKNADLEKQAQAAKQKEIEETAKLLAASNYSGNFSGKFTWPVPGVYIVTAMFFDKEYLTLTGINHTGFDIGASQGHNVVAMEDGVVIKADYMAGGYGNYVVINHGASSDGYTYATLYGHNSALCVKKGDIVTKGQKIAISGNTGFSSAAHVHIEVIKAKGSANWVVDGMDYFNASQAPFTYQSYGKVISYPFENESQYQYKKISTRSTIVQ